MPIKFISSKVNKKTYNFLIIISLWLLFIFIHYFFWDLIINSFRSNLSIVLYILFIPILLCFFIYKLSLLEDKKDKKIIIIFGILVPLFIYYVSVILFIYLAIKAFQNSSFPF